MTGDLDIINGVVKFIGSLSIEALLFVSVIIVGYGLKLVPQMPNKLIPLVVLAVPAVVYPFIGNPGKLNPDFGDMGQMKWAMAMQGLIIGFAAWISHAKVLRKLIDEKLNGALNPEKRVDAPEPPKPEVKP